MKKVLVKFSRDWADEFQVEGFVVVEPAEAEELKEYFSTERSWYFGTNEGWEDEILIGSFDFVEISLLHAAALNQLFPGGMGHVPAADYWEDDDDL